MHIITETQEISRILQNLGHGLIADSFSWQSWHVVMVHTRPPAHGMQQGKIAAEIKSLLNEDDGALLWFDNGTCIGIVEKNDSFSFKVFEKDLRKNARAFGCEITVAILSVERNLQDILLLLAHQLKECGLSAIKNTHEIPDLGASVSRLDELLPLWQKTQLTGKLRQQPHIMVVDDDGLTRCIISQSLKNDYALLTAESVPEAVRKHILFAPNIVFLDITMPDHDGFAFLRYIRQYDRDCKVVMFSSNGYLENRLTAFAAGASGFVVKPYHRKSFAHYIDAWHAANQIASAMGRVAL